MSPSSGACLLLSLGLLALGGCATQAPAAAGRPALTLPPLQDGDVLLSGSTGWRSWMVLSNDSKNTPYSHAALILVEDGQPVLVHASPSSSTRMASLPLTDYLASPVLRHLAVYRADDPALAARAAAEARRYLALSIPFDADYDISDDSKLYCTEMIWRSYLNAGIDLLGTPRRPLRPAPVFGPMIWPSDFVEMPALKPVFAVALP